MLEDAIMKRLIIFGLLAMLVIVAGCAQEAPEQTAEPVTEPAATTGDSVLLDASASEADALTADLDTEDVDQQLADLNPEEVKDINF